MPSMREISADTSPKLVLAALGISIAMHFFAISVIPHPGRLPFKRPVRVEVELTTRTLPLPEEVPVPLPPPAEIEEPATPEPIAKTASPPSQPRLQTAPALPKKSTDAPRLAKSRKPNEVALPVLAAKEGAADESYAVPELPPARSLDELPMGTRPGAEPFGTAPSATAETSSDGSGTADGAGDEAALQGYVRRLHERAKKHRSYPAIALKRGWQGRVRVAVSFASGGTVTSVKLDRSSGHSVLDEQAVEIVRQAVSDLPIEARLARRPLTIVVPVDFRLSR
jgi:protein TonB